MRVSPALDLRFTSESAAPELSDRLVAGLDDFHPTAIDESPTVWRVFFDSPSARADALAWLRGLSDPRLTTDGVDVEDGDWARRSQADLRAVRIGRIVVAPPWCADDARRQAQGDDLVLVVAPSTGFGTGHHASTRLCLILLQQTPVRGRSVLDVGTGSGVLALAAACLGARSVVAIDNDPDAIDAAREDVALNRLNALVHLVCSDFRAIEAQRADVVLANLTGEMIRRAATDLVRCVHAGGDLIVSGVLAEEQDSVVAALARAGATAVTRLCEEEWTGLRFRIEN